jgi:hypothetical protein
MSVPSVARCALMLLAVRARLKARGFGPSVSWARAQALRASGPGLAPEEVVCLEQSLALYLLLRRRGVPAELRIGVQVYPFYAHAWVELDGRPVNEDVETVEKFRALPEVAA